MAVNQGIGDKWYRICCEDSSLAMSCSDWKRVTIGDCAIPTPPAPPVEPSFAVTVNPGQNLPSIVAGNPAGTTYLLTNGVHGFSDVVPKDGDQFWGQSRTGTIIDGTGQAGRIAFRSNADSVVISRMTIRDFGVGTPPGSQEQAAILGKVSEFALGVNDYASNWRIDDCTLDNNGNGGVYSGNDFVITRNEIMNHGVTGLGAAYIAGGLVQGNYIHDNANNPAVGAGDNGAGIKYVNINQVGGFFYTPPFAPVYVIDNLVERNNGRGIWFDIDCHGCIALNNEVNEPAGGAFGIFYELCNGDGPNTLGNRAECNVVTGPLGFNNWQGTNFGANGAICFGESHNCVAKNNTIVGASVGFMNRLAGRGMAENNGGDGYVDVLFSRNELANSHAAIAPGALSNIGTSNNWCLDNTFINCDTWGDHIGISHAGFSLHTTHTYSNNDITGSPGIIHYFNGVNSGWPVGGRS